MSPSAGSVSGAPADSVRSTPAAGSIDSGPVGSTPAGSESPAKGQRGFWRLSLILCAVLAVVAVGLGAVGVVRGPDLAQATFAPDRAVSAAGERLALRSRLPIADVDAAQVRVTPAVPFTISTRDSTLSITFAAPLAYATRYTVEVTGVRSRYTDTSADWSYAFDTPQVTLYSLIARRDGTADDTIVTSGDAPRTLLTAPGIDAYIATRRHLVAVSHADPESSELVAVSREDAAPVAVRAPKVPLITELGVAPDGSRFGYLVTGTDAETGVGYEGVLFIADAADLGAAPVEVQAGGGPLAVQEWLFVPGVNAVVVVTPQEKGFLIYLDGGTAPVPLGTVAQLVGFLPGSTMLLAQAGGKQVLLDLARGRTTDVTDTADPAEDTFAGRRAFRTPEDYVAEFNQFKRSGGTTAITTRLTHVIGDKATDLLVVRPGDGQLLNSGLSPNGQFAWAVVLDPDAPLDDLSSGASDNAETVIFDLATGEQVASVPGSSPVWAP